MKDTTVRKFWSNVVIGHKGCLEWIGLQYTNGYGQFHSNSRLVRAHRYSYELMTGKIATGLVIDHLCRNKLCVRPSHLEAVTIKENNRRGLIGNMNGTMLTNYNNLKTHCINGHEFTAGNTVYRGNWRRCRECNKIKSKRYYEQVTKRRRTL